MTLFKLLSGVYVEYYRDPAFLINLAVLGSETLFNKNFSNPTYDFLIAIEKIG